MRVVSCLTEREVDCACGARLSFWPSDVVNDYTATLAPEPADAGGVLMVRDMRHVRGVRCPCCMQLVEVDGG